MYNYFIMKNLLNLGKALTKAEQKSINGGVGCQRSCFNQGRMCVQTTRFCISFTEPGRCCNGTGKCIWN